MSNVWLDMDVNNFPIFTTEGAECTENLGFIPLCSLWLCYVALIRKVIIDQSLLSNALLKAMCALVVESTPTINTNIALFNPLKYARCFPRLNPG